LALPTNGAVSLIQRNSKTSRLILLVLFVSMVISICVALFLIVRAAKREMSLCAAFIKQMDATQEAERKSMNKSQALAGASHDIRSSLAAITAWIELSHDCNTDSVMQANLSQMHACTKDLLSNCSS
jgi:signal transduction histidine kinase